MTWEEIKNLTPSNGAIKDLKELLIMIERAFKKIFEHWYEVINPSGDYSVEPLKYVRNAAAISNNNA